jgi:ATP synthase protein I
MVRAVFKGVQGRWIVSRAGVESMADAPDKDDRPANRTSAETDLSARLKGLGAKLGKTGQPKPAENDSGKYVSDPQAMAKGFRLSTELVAGVIVGAIIGWVFDRLTGFSPWGLIVFLLLGFVAGVLNVMRAAGVVAPSKLPGGNADKP